ncbi:hypothetical protein [Streptomyces sp. NPDC017964]|uniref:phosphotriesterase family protein n=1 Tax=Streptomyces sp. NPDC017964 TaxID=3365022 RepID=UPI00378E7012
MGRARHRERPRGFDKAACRRRSVVERCFHRLKQWRGIATGYDKQPDSSALLRAAARSRISPTCGTARAGVRTLVDMTVLGQGCDIGLVRAVAERTPVDIVLATGVYSVDGIPLFARLRGGRGRGFCGRGARRGLLSP